MNKSFRSLQGKLKTDQMKPLLLSLFFLVLLQFSYAQTSSERPHNLVYSGFGIGDYRVIRQGTSYTAGALTTFGKHSAFSLGMVFNYNDEPSFIPSMYNYLHYTSWDLIYWYELINKGRHSFNCGAGVFLANTKLNVIGLETSGYPVSLWNSIRYSTVNKTFWQPGVLGACWYQYHVTNAIQLGLKATFGRLSHEKQPSVRTSNEYLLTICFALPK